MTHIAVVAHEAQRTGPPMVLLDFLQHVRSVGIAVTTYLLEGGPLVPAFEALGPTHVLEEHPGRIPDRADHRRHRLHRERLAGADRPDLVLVNTAISIRGLRLLPESWRPVVTILHELDVGLRTHLRSVDHRSLLQESDHVIAGAACIAKNFVDGHAYPAERVTVAHEFIPPRPKPEHRTDPAVLRRRLAIPADAAVVGGAGGVNWRKAPDLFVALADEMTRHAVRDTYFVWIGGPRSGPLYEQVDADLALLGLRDRVRFVGAQIDFLDYLAMCDVFALPSRQDAFPLVCLHAASVGVPTAAFDTGCIGEFITEACGGMVPYPQLEELAATINGWLADRERLSHLGQAARDRVQSGFSSPEGADRWLSVLERTTGMVRP